MKSIKNLLLVASLLPFLFVVYVSTLNINKNIRLKVLIWESNQQSISSLILLGSIVGFSISSLNVYLLSIKPRIIKTRVTKTVQSANDSSFENNYMEDNDNSFQDKSLDYIERDIREPSPTVSVPYRIISRKGEANLYSSRNKDYINLEKQAYDKNDKTQDDQIINEGWGNIDFEQW